MQALPHGRRGDKPCAPSISRQAMLSRSCGGPAHPKAESAHSLVAETTKLPPGARRSSLLAVRGCLQSRGLWSTPLCMGTAEISHLQVGKCRNVGCSYVGTQMPYIPYSPRFEDVTEPPADRKPAAGLRQSCCRSATSNKEPPKVPIDSVGHGLEGGHIALALQKCCHHRARMDRI